MKYDRLLEIENFIKAKKSVTIEELLETFNISVQTLRRDLKELEDKGSVKKVYVVLSIMGKVLLLILPIER